MRNLFSGKKMIRFSMSFLLAAAIAVLAGCGAGGSASGTSAASGVAATPTQTITGTVATGAPLADATITIKDSSAIAKTATGSSAADGAFSIPVTGMTPPFMLVASKAGQQNMYSILPAMDMASTNTQNVNITPVTTLVMYELTGGADPATMYSSGSFSTATAANVSANETMVRSKLPANTVNPVFSMMYGKFVASVQSPNPDPYDAALDGIGKITGITSASMTFSRAPAYTAGTPATPVTPVLTPSIALTLTDTTTPYAARTSISNSSPARVTATVKNANGAPVAGVVVTFTTSDPARDTFLNGANTALTDINGVAYATLTTSNTSGGANTVTASATVSGTAVTNSLSYAIGSSTITLSALTLPATALSAYGTASISVKVLNNGATYTTPITVSFASACASSGKATLTASVTTVNGTATANYLDNGCNNVLPGDTITATLMNGVTATGNLPVNSPAIGSIQFVSVVTNPVTTPVMITIKGTGGTNRSETARVTFRVVDSAGNPLGNAPVDFSLNTALGGLTLSSAAATSDPTTGYVVTNVQAGTMSTAVRVTAKVHNTTLSTQSDQLLISTGIPAQDGISLSASTHNIEAWLYDGITTTLTARLSDHFHNPVPDGTAVYFTSEGGSVIPSCITVGGICTAVLTSQELRPRSAINGYGRVTVLARATGEETFIDLNSNGTADDVYEMIDANRASTDMGEAYVDYNESNCRDPQTEPYIDFNGNGVYDGKYCGFSPPGGPEGDSLYNGLLCTAGAAICSTQKSLDVRVSQVIIFSDSWGASPATLVTYTGGGAAYNAAVATFNATFGATPAETATYNAAVAAYAAATVTYNAAVVAYNSDPTHAAPGTDVATYNAAVAAYATATATYNAAVAVYNAALMPTAGEIAAFNAVSSIPPIAAPPIPAGLKVTSTQPGIVLPSCTTVNPMGEARPATVTVTVVDTNGNAMPAGTKIDFTTDNGSVPTPASWTVPDTIGCRTGFPGCPASAASPTFGDIAVSLISDATYAVGPPATCTNAKSGGTFFVKVTTPKGSITNYTMGIID